MAEWRKDGNAAGKDAPLVLASQIRRIAALVKMYKVKQCTGWPAENEVRGVTA